LSRRTHKEGAVAQVARAELLETLQRLLEFPAADLKVALSQACDAVAAAVNADKVDVFIHNPQSDCLVAEEHPKT
jgi:hypothetical protein